MSEVNECRSVVDYCGMCASTRLKLWRQRWDHGTLRLRHEIAHASKFGRVAQKSVAECLTGSERWGLEIRTLCACFSSAGIYVARSTLVCASARIPRSALNTNCQYL